MTIVMPTGPQGLAGVVPMLLRFQPALWLRRHPRLDWIGGHLHTQYPDPDGTDQGKRAAGLDDYYAVIEAIVQRTRPIILTALAAVLAFIPITHSVFWGSMA